MKNKYSPDPKNQLQSYRMELIEILPCLLYKATNEYRDFSARQASTDVKTFAAYQTACRTALTHLQLLLKIAVWAERAVNDEIMIDDDETNLEKLIIAAQDALK